MKVLFGLHCRVQQDSSTLVLVFLTLIETTFHQQCPLLMTLAGKYYVAPGLLLVVNSQTFKSSCSTGPLSHNSFIKVAYRKWI